MILCLVIFGEKMQFHEIFQDLGLHSMSQNQKISGFLKVCGCILDNFQKTIQFSQTFKKPHGFKKVCEIFVGLKKVFQKCWPWDVDVTCNHAKTEICGPHDTYLLSTCSNASSKSWKFRETRVFTNVFVENSLGTRKLLALKKISERKATEIFF